MPGKSILYEQGLEAYPKSGAILGNLVMLVWMTLGTIACRFVSPLAGWLYLAIALGMVYVVLRKLVCTNCYYYDKLCAIGWGKLAARFFKPGKIENFSTCAGIKIAPATYGALTLIPVVLLVISLFQQFTWTKILVLVFLLLISFYSGTISRKKSCARCKMRLVCPGSAVK